MEWRCISTARHDDGKHVLLFGDGPAICRCTYVGYWDEEFDDGGVWKLITGEECRPTHWMPLPLPPKQNGE